MTDTPDYNGTRNRLLEAAGEVFARRGFEQATVREICAAAGANVAAVNYHFGDKQCLYAETLQHWYGELVRQYPPDLGAASDDPAEERLHAFVRSYFLRLFGGGKPELLTRLILREMSEPTDAINLVAQKTIKPMRDLLVSIVAEILGPRASEQQVFHGATSVIGQIAFHRICNPMIRKLFPRHKYQENDIEQLARHVTEFTLAGLRAMRTKGGGGK